MPKKQRTGKAQGMVSAKASIPAAGLGKCFRPLSSVVPKELLPVDRKPLIQWSPVSAISESSSRDGEQAMVGFGRTYFPEGVTQFFSNGYMNPETGEVDLLPTFYAMVQKIKNYAILLEGRPMDFGTWSGYELFSQILNPAGNSAPDQAGSTHYE